MKYEVVKFFKGHRKESVARFTNKDVAEAYKWTLNKKALRTFNMVRYRVIEMQ